MAVRPRLFLMSLLPCSFIPHSRLLSLSITEMQEQKEALVVLANATAAEQLTLEMESATLRHALGNITSSLHWLLTSPEPEETNGAGLPNNTTGVSLGCHLQGANGIQEQLRSTEAISLRLWSNGQICTDLLTFN